MSRIVTGLGYAAPKYKLPYYLVYFIALLLHVVALLFKPLCGELKFSFTPMKVALAGTHHYYSCAAAKRELDYSPLYSMDEAIEKTLNTFQYLRADSSMK